MKIIFRVALALVLAIVMLIPAAGVLAKTTTSSCTGTITINVKESTLDQQDSCTDGVVLWHFIINQIKAPTATYAPATIHVTWDNGAEEDVPYNQLSGPAAHYTTTSNAGHKVTDATAVIYCAWPGEFVLSHVNCTGYGSKSGIKFNDINKNGTQEAGEWEMPGWTIYVDYNDNGTLDAPDEPSAVTGADGSYTITGIKPGTWKIREVLQDDWYCSLPTTTDVYGHYYEETFESGTELFGNDFGNWNPEITTQSTPVTEVGGKIYPVNQFLLMVPAIALGVAILSVIGIIVRRRMIQK